MAKPIEIFSFPPESGDLEPFDLGSGELGALLIHGFCGTPPEVRGLGEHLAAAGLRVRGTLLRGHGTTPQELERFGWRDWVEGARADLELLKSSCSAVFVAGQSMGGTIALRLAQTDRDIRAVATLSALVRLSAWTEAQLRYGRFVKRWYYPDRDAVDLTDVTAVRLLRSYNQRSLRSHWEMLQLMRQARARLGEITVPALVLHGLRDALVPASNAEAIRSAVAGPAEVRYFERSGHAMTVDVERDEIFELITAHFLRAARSDQPMTAARV